MPMGTTLREVIFDIGGGVKGGDFKAVQIGGPSGGCLCISATEDHLDMKLDFDSLKKVGAMIGSGGLVVMNDKSCMVEVARFFMNFTQNESCGKCVPCREGTKRMLELLTDITEGRGTMEHIELLEKLADTISATAWARRRRHRLSVRSNISVMSIFLMLLIKNVRQASARR